MRKQLWAAAALVLLALQPARAQSKSPTVTTFNFEVLQARPCSFKRTFIGPQLPSDILWTGCCIGGDPKGGIKTPSGQGLACRFIGNVLCLDPGANGDFASFAIGCPAGSSPVIQG